MPISSHDSLHRQALQGSLLPEAVSYPELARSILCQPDMDNTHQAAHTNPHVTESKSMSKSCKLPATHAIYVGMWWR